MRNLQAINDSGQAVGWLWNADAGHYHASLYDGTTVKDLGTMGEDSSFAYDINNLGQVVGHLSGEHAFSYADGLMQDLGSPYRALGVNDSGTVVGISVPGGGAWGSAFVWADGQRKNLNDLIPSDSGWQLETALDINNAGQIVGAGLVGGYGRAFLLTPVPEPCTLSLLAVGAVALCRRRIAATRNSRPAIK